MQTFNIVRQSNIGHPYLSAVQGERITVNGIPCFVFEEIDEIPHHGDVSSYNVSHLETGARVCFDLTKEAAIEKAKMLFKKDVEAIERMKAKIVEFGLKLPINE